MLNRMRPKLKKFHRRVGPRAELKAFPVNSLLICGGVDSEGSRQRELRIVLPDCRPDECRLGSDLRFGATNVWSSSQQVGRDPDRDRFGS